MKIAWTDLINNSESHDDVVLIMYIFVSLIILFDLGMGYDCYDT